MWWQRKSFGGSEQNPIFAHYDLKKSPPQISKELKQEIEENPNHFTFSISPQGVEIFKKAFPANSEESVIIRTAAAPPTQEQLVIEEKLSEKVDSNEIKVMFRDLKADVQKKIDKTVSEINERFEKIENQVHDIQTMQPIPQKSEPSRKLPRLVIGLIVLISFLMPTKSLHEPKIEPPKIEKKQVISPPRSKVTKKKSAGPITALKEMWKLIGRTLQ